MIKQYKVAISQSGKIDIKNRKHYIIENFKYRDYAENFSNVIKKAAQELNMLPTAYQMTGFSYCGYDIYIKPKAGYLLFYTVDEKNMVVTVLRVLQDGMDWKYIIEQWIDINKIEK